MSFTARKGFQSQKALERWQFAPSLRRCVVRFNLLAVKSAIFSDIRPSASVAPDSASAIGLRLAYTRTPSVKPAPLHRSSATEYVFVPPASGPRNTRTETAADGRVSVPYPGTEDGWNQRDVVRSRRGSPIAFWGKDEGGVFVSSLVLPLEAGEVVTSRARVRIDGLGRIVTALRAAVR